MGKQKPKNVENPLDDKQYDDFTSSENFVLTRWLRQGFQKHALFMHLCNHVFWS